jgi:hypothetical protein
MSFWFLQQRYSCKAKDIFASTAIYGHPARSGNSLFGSFRTGMASARLAKTILTMRQQISSVMTTEERRLRAGSPFANLRPVLGMDF